MNTNTSEDSLIVDPDYESNNSAIRRVELKGTEGTKDSLDQISKIVKEEFDKEIVARQKQVERIEEQLFKAQKLLHIVRYVLITSYYNNKALEYKEDEQSTSDVNSIFENQNRIHPAIKKLLGKNANPLQILNPGSKRKTSHRNESLDVNLQEAAAVKRIKLEAVEGNTIDTSSTSEESIKLVPTTSQIKVEDGLISGSGSCGRNRKKSKHRIMVGNISKWMPSLEDDNLTHKWMVYVRGTKEAPDVSHFVDKVTFHLHPSYKPYDVVEVSEPPFHLARRGWGEFPIRVQVFFKNPLNKPVDVIHNLKLDKTCTGRQTLGNETIVDIFLHGDHDSCKEIGDVLETKSKTEFDFTSKTAVKQESEIDVEYNHFLPFEVDSVKIEIEDTEESVSGTEHDYCFEDNTTVATQNEEELLINEPQENTAEFENSLIFADHNYSHSYTTEEHPSALKTSPVVEQDKNNSLIYGLDESYTQTIDDYSTRDLLNSGEKAKGPILKTLTTSTGKPICFLPQSFSKILLSNGNVVTVKIKPGQTLLKKTISSDFSSWLCTATQQEEKVDLEKYKIILPKNKFKNMGEVLPYLFKKLPLFHALADDLSYKCTFPFTARNFKEYSSWYLPKRLSSEWSRAKAIRKILLAEKFFESEKWNTKAILMYGRSHFYTPLTTFEIFNKSSPEKNLLLRCYENCDPQINKFVFDVNLDVESDLAIVDVENEDIDSPIKLNKKIDISDPELGPHCTFIKQQALDCGIVLKPEEIIKDVLFNGAESMMLEAVKCFAENLIRRAANHVVCKENFEDESSEIKAEDIKTALNERPDMALIAKFRKKKREIDYFL